MWLSMYILNFSFFFSPNITKNNNSFAIHVVWCALLIGQCCRRLMLFFIQIVFRWTGRDFILLFASSSFLFHFQSVAVCT